MNPKRMMVCLIAAVFLSGCANRPINPPLEKVDPHSGYRPLVKFASRQNNDPSTLFVLSFSGGGTRAAAFAYGVLLELNSVEFDIGGSTRRLIDEVDAITGVSGGSFTALSYALYGDRLFTEYESRFLKRDVQSKLTWMTLNPFNWPKLMSGNYGRSEMAAEYYDEILFENATFADLLEKPGPIAIATGTNLTTGSRLAYFQNDFDIICSDLSAVRLSRAAATSSAVPAVLSPVTLNNYGGSCGYEYPPWVADAQNLRPGQRPAARALERAKEMKVFEDSTNRPYLHLVDGGVADNIGVRGVLEALESLGLSATFREDTGFSKLRRIVLIVVNSKSEQEKNWERKESPPGTVTQLMQSAGVPIERYSFETVELMKDRVEIAGMRRDLAVAEARLAGATEEEAEAQFPKIELNVLDISFDQVQDSGERAYLKSLPTSFSLPAEAVDHLVTSAGELLRQSTEYQKYFQVMKARRVVAQEVRAESAEME
jgi:NTE family protein